MIEDGCLVIGEMLHLIYTNICDLIGKVAWWKLKLFSFKKVLASDNGKLNAPVLLRYLMLSRVVLQGIASFRCGK